MSNRDHHHCPSFLDVLIFAFITYVLIRLLVWLFSKPKGQNPNNQK